MNFIRKLYFYVSCCFVLGDLKLEGNIPFWNVKGYWWQSFEWWSRWLRSQSITRIASKLFWCCLALISHTSQPEHCQHEHRNVCMFMEIFFSGFQNIFSYFSNVRHQKFFRVKRLAACLFLSFTSRWWIRHEVGSQIHTEIYIRRSDVIHKYSSRD